MLHDKPAELLAAITTAPTTSPQPVSEEIVSQIVSMGFDADVVRAALRHFGADIDQVVAELVQRAGNIPDDWFEGFPSVQQPSASSTTSVNTSNSSDSGECL